MKSYTIQEYLDANCEEMKDLTMRAVHGLSNGKVCDTGCHAFDNGKCTAYKNLISNQKAETQSNFEIVETVREEAKRRNISISEVRRQRRDRQDNF